MEGYRHEEVTGLWTFQTSRIANGSAKIHCGINIIVGVYVNYELEVA
jgi:hypothetical protein